MEKKHNGQDIKHKAEEWMIIAKKFGEDCLVIQKNSALTVDQKHEKQKALAHKITKDIEASPDLTAEDKRKMIDSVNQYLDEWKILDTVGSKTSSH